MSLQLTHGHESSDPAPPGPPPPLRGRIEVGGDFLGNPIRGVVARRSRSDLSEIPRRTCNDKFCLFRSNLPPIPVANQLPVPIEPPPGPPMLVQISDLIDTPLIGGEEYKVALVKFSDYRHRMRLTPQRAQ